MMTPEALDVHGAWIDVLNYACHEDAHYGAGAFIAYQKYCEEVEREGPMGECPKHGKQPLIRNESTRGSDPYNIEVLACGDRVIWFSKDDGMIV